MKKIVAYLLLIAFVFSDFFSFLGVFAGANLVINQFGIQVNGGPRISGTTFADPGNTLKILVGGQNLGDVTTNVGIDYSFSHNQFTYVSPATIDVYKNFEPVYSNVPTSEFNPPSDNSFVLLPESQPQDYIDVYYLQLKIDKNTSQPLLSIGANFTADGFYVGNKVTRDVYVDVRPHVIDYFFEKSDTTVTTQVQGSYAEPVNFVMKIKDKNGCENIDGGTVKVDLFQLGASNEEVLSYVGCDADTMTSTFKKTGITTDAALGTYVFDPATFQIVDENNNSFLLDDPNTSFDDIDKKSPLSLTVIPASAPDVKLQNVQNTFIGGPSTQNFAFDILANQNGEYKVVLGSDGTCSVGNILQDWTTGILSNTNFSVSFASSSFAVGGNSLQVCVKNSGGNIGSYTLNVTKDTTAPVLSGLSVSPASVILNNTTVAWVCSENGTYELRLGGTGNKDGQFIGSGTILASQQKNTQILNSSLVIGDNQIYAYCEDQASNFSSKATSVKKVPPTPDMTGVATFIDNDFDFQGIDGRDITVTWNNSAAVGYADFESYRIYLLPENISFNPANQSYVALLPQKNLTTFTGISSLVKDSQNTNFVSGGKYKACVAIMGTNGMLGGATCSSGSVITSDNVYNAKITQAKFTSNTTLELTTDTTLDTNTSIHSGALVSYQVAGNSLSATSVTSVNGSKILLNIQPLNNPSASGTNLVVFTGAIRSSVGGFNNYFSNGSIIITDGQAPVISGWNISASTYASFYSGSVTLSYNFSENMQAGGVTRLVFERSGGNTSENKYFSITDSTKLLAGNQSFTLNLADVGLVNGSYYNVKLEGKDIAGNYVLSSAVPLKYDAGAPDTVVIKNQADSAIATPTLEWNAASDNNGNGSGIQSYTVFIYSNSACTSTPSQTLSTSSLSITTPSLVNGSYSFAVRAVDKMGNIGQNSNCDAFLVDTTIPTISQGKLTDTIINSALFTKNNNQVRLSASLENTQSDKIVADLSNITGNLSHTGVVCSAPGSGISCSFSGGNLAYVFNAGTITDGMKSVKLSVTTPSGVTTVSQNIAITFDSTSPSIGNIVSPTTLSYGGNTLSVSYNGVSDTNLDFIQYEYSSNSGSTWNLIGTGSNTGNFTWDISSLGSGSQYKLRITAFDRAKNSSVMTSGVFSLDKVAPAIAPNIFTNVNNTTYLKGNVTTTLTWNAGGITDAGGLKTFPISLYYSTDSGSTWQTIKKSIANSGTYAWAIPNINSQSLQLKLEAEDIVGNVTSQITSFGFVVDSTLPILDVGVSTPPNGVFVNNNGFEISGTVSDTNLKQVGYIFQRKSDNKYWNGTAYVSGSVNVILQDNISGTSYNFSSGIASGAVINSTQYDLTLYSIDKSGNITYSSVRDYTGDIDGPALNTTSASYFSQEITFTGTTSDALSGISSVKISIEKSGQYWNGTTYQNDEVLLNVSTANNYGNWSYTFIPELADIHAQQYSVKAYAFDKSYKINNVTTQTVSTIRDIQAPVIDSEIFTFNTNTLYIGGENMNITWNVSGVTDGLSGIAPNKVKLDFFDGTAWSLIAQNLSNNGSYNWTIANADTPNARVRITFLDAVGNTSFVNSQAFLVDSTPPEVVKIETMDMDTNGQIDALYVEMSESIVDSSIILSDFSISGIGAPTSIETGAAADDNIFVLRFLNTGNTATTPNLSYTKGNLRDKAGKKLESFTNKSSVDKAVARILSGAYQDQNRDGKIDLITLNISENLSSSSTLQGWTLENPLVGMNITSVNISGNQIELQLSQGSEFSTFISGFALSLTNTVYQDLAGNTLAGVTSFLLSDEAQPLVLEAKSMDKNANSKLDTIQVKFSENITGVNYADFTVNNLKTGSNYLGAGAQSSNILELQISETSLSYDTDTTATVGYNSTNIQDLAGNILPNFSLNVQDGIVPKLLQATTKDTNNNGKLDIVVLDFSENISGNNTGLVTSVPGYVGTINTLSGTQMFLGVEEKSIIDTTVVPTISIVSNSSVVDVGGNLISTASMGSIDGIGPVIIGAVYDENLHELKLTYSEEITTSLTQSSFVFQSMGSVTGVSYDGGNKVLTVSGENVDFTQSKISFLANSVSDTSGNKQSQTVFASVTAPIIINEVLKSNTTANNYVELKNLSSSTVSIAGMQIAGITLPNGAQIGPNGLYLIAKESKVNSIVNIDADLIDSSLNMPLTLSLTLSGVVVDRAKLDLGYLDMTLPASMERRNPPGDGYDANSWYQAVVSSGFDTMTPLGTPGAENVEDNIAPTLISISPSENTLLPYGNIEVLASYEDNVGGVGVDVSSIKLSLQAYSGSLWSGNILSSYISGSIEKNSDNTKVQLIDLPAGKYKTILSVEDKAGNLLENENIFYVDAFEVTLSSGSAEIGELNFVGTQYAPEVILTLKTLGAGFDITSIGGDITSGVSSIGYFDGNNGWGADINKNGNGYVGSLTSMDNYQLDQISKNINTNGEIQTFTYKIRYGGKASALMSAGNYSGNANISVQANY